MTRSEIERLEISLLLEAIYERYGYDFRAYARASVDRRVRQFLAESGCRAVSEMIPKVLHDEAFFSRLVQYFSVSVTEMFRDPFVYRAIRKEVVPILRTYPFFKVWHAGCATGEEVYSLAILLKEEGLYERATIYATDISAVALEKAREGIYALGNIQRFTANYQQAGGQASLADYYHGRYGSVIVDGSLKERITFATHNLVSDNVFSETHLVFCRNVLIYFNQELKNRALGLFTDSLVHGGFLCLGTREDLWLTDATGHYGLVDKKAQIYKRNTPR